MDEVNSGPNRVIRGVSPIEMDRKEMLNLLEMSKVASEDYSLNFSVEIRKGQRIDPQVLAGIHSLFRILVDGRPDDHAPHEPLRGWSQWKDEPRLSKLKAPDEK